MVEVSNVVAKVTSGSKVPITVELTFEVVAPTPTPPTPTPVVKQVAGASAATQAKFDALNTMCGPFTSRRTFNGGPLPTSFQMAACSADPGRGFYTVYSFKENPTTFKSGARDAAFKAFITSWPKGHKGIITSWHEPENDRSSYSVADWKAMINRMGGLLHAAGRPEIKMAIILMGSWTFAGGNGWGDVDWWDPGFDQSVDVIGFDQYRYHPTDGSLYSMMNLVPGGGTTSPIKFIEAHKKPWFMGEWGCTDDVGQTEKARWIIEAATWMKARNDCIGWTYFNNNLDLGSAPTASWEIQAGAATVALKNAVAIAHKST